MSLMLLVVAIIMIIAVISNRISNKVGIPVLLAFILLGIIFGEDGILKIPFENYSFAEQICSIALIFIMFYGGFGTKWSHAKSVAKPSIMLSTLGVILSALFVALFCFFILKIDMMYSFLIGSVISSTDAASVFSILRSRKLSLKYKTDSILELESGSNDPASYMLTILAVTIINSGINLSTAYYLVFSQIAYALISAFIISFISVYIFKKAKPTTEGFGSILVLAIALVSYSLPSVFGGNGYLSVYIVGIVLGNTKMHDKKNLVSFFDGLTNLMQILIFFLLGLLSKPSVLPQIIIIASSVAIFLTFIARPLAVYLLMKPTKASNNQIALISWSGLRGASSIVFATMATIAISNPTYDVFHIVFFIVLISISIQGTLIPFVAKKLDMIDLSGNVMKTFTDYSDEVDVQFVKLSMEQENRWIGKKLNELSLPPSTLIVMIIRDAKSIVPKGDTTIHKNDTVILSAASVDENIAVNLREVHIDSNSEYVGKYIKDMDDMGKNLVVLIKRKSGNLIPNGNTLIKNGDILVKRIID